MSPEVTAPPIIDFSEALRGASSIKRGFIKCRLVHMKDRSFVLPDILLSSEIKGEFYSPKFFTPNQIAFFGGDGSADFCRLTLELLNGNDVQVAFFGRDLVKTCSDGSFIYKCAFSPSVKKGLPAPCGKWRRRDGSFEVLLYHHTNSSAAAGIKASKELWDSPWNIQGSKKLENIGYCYFTSIPAIRSELHLREVAMSQMGTAHFLPTNAPYSAEFASALAVPKRTPKDMDRSLRFWVDLETVSPSHIWLHRPWSAPAYYENVLPRVFRLGVNPGYHLPLDGNRISIDPAQAKVLKYVVVGDASSPEGLAAPYNEENTLLLAKIDDISNGSEIIARWKEKQNSHLFPSMSVEMARMIENSS
ncbi:hypothetical protein [Thioclava electrotropha]|uniref:Uncharacterized protein n=1 Tax=Thioclava electrotropha TaxID=1549850 RepID=A0ABX6YTQ0_9RHOB|nr:hypothetical protein [Thioclava electrotropha]QPZ91204.1 hypothetical protein AKL02_010020 [Thioclava electrotropha]